VRGIDVAHRLEAKGIKIRTASMSSLAEEASEAYKDVAQVVEVAHQAGISRKVAKFRPIGVIKG
jgi:tRNA-splicing ligase RtcB